MTVAPVAVTEEIPRGFDQKEATAAIQRPSRHTVHRPCLHVVLQRRQFVWLEKKGEELGLDPHETQ